jgi:hypothetical protein
MQNPEPALASRIGGMIGKVAPTIAGALGGPLAGAAMQALSKAVLGESSAVAEDIETVVLAQRPETLAALKKAELDFRRAILDADLEARRIAAGDRADARARQIAVRDATPAVLGLGVISGFFFVLTLMLLRQLPSEADTEFSIMLGALATMTAAVVNYYFGSSADSREKTKLIGSRGL